MSATGKVKMFYVTTPAIEWFGGSEAAYGLQLRRNEHFRSAASQFRGHIVPLDKMAATNHFLRAEGPHYQCKYDADSWSQVKDMRPPTHFDGCKWCKQGDCKDKLNLNVVQIIASSVESGREE